VFGAVRRDEPFAFATPAGPRRFRLIVCRETADRPAIAAILDTDRDRVLLAIQEVTGTASSVEEELAPVLAMPWDAFCAFVNAHPKRRYRVEARHLDAHGISRSEPAASVPPTGSPP
jgi:hypothetical protein